MNSPTNPAPTKATDAARDALAKALGRREIEVTLTETEVVPGTGEHLVRVTAIAPGHPNAPQRVVVDAAGKVHDLAAVEAAVGRRLFVPDIGIVPGHPVLPDPVTIDPSTNDLTLPLCKQESERITVTIPKSGVKPKADVYLLSDTTGSMTSIIDAVKAGAGAIVGNPALAGFDVAYGVGNYKDFPHDPYAFQHQLSPTTNTVSVTAAVATWIAGGGSDTPEGQLYALHRLAVDPAIGWRAGARRIVVWFGDAPGHDPVCVALTGEGAAVTEASVIANLGAAAITVVAISTTTGTPGALDGVPTLGATDYTAACGAPGGAPLQATHITAATGGSHTTGVNAATIVATLTALIAAAVTSTGNVQLVPSAGIVGFVASISPAGGYGPLPGNVPHVLPFDVVWVGNVACGPKPLVFTGTLDVIADGMIVAQKKVRIVVPACRYHHSVEMVCGRHPDREERCETVVPGRYATAVTIYNPSACSVVIEKYFAPLVLRGEPIGREPRTVPARPFAKIELKPGEATMDDCCSLEQAIGPTGGALTLGVLDIVADHRLEVVAILTATGLEKSGANAASIHTRQVLPRVL
jgi:hypothetical protein